MLKSRTLPAQTTPQPAGGKAVRRYQNRFVAATLTPILLYMLLFTLFPMLWGITLSFFNYSAARQGTGLLDLGGANPFIGLGNFQAMLASGKQATQFRTSLFNTLIFAFAVLPINLAITLPLAALLESVSDRVKTLFRGIYFLPTVTASVAVALIWGFLYHPTQGLFNTLIKMLGGTPIAWLTDPRMNILGVPIAMFAVIFAYVWQDMGYNLIIFIAALQGIPRQLKEAAFVDGANAFQAFWYIMLPLLRPTLLFVCVMTMISSFQVFEIFQVMTGGGPRDQTLTMVQNIYDNAFRFQRMGWASAMSLVLFLLIMVVTVVQMRLLRTQWEY
jgi:multiple sugar transport system permease protein